jgi:ElaB/YqjD/DUF883 family membrane-anchored ribosome-binding protein
MGDNRNDLPEGTDTVIDTDASSSGDIVVTETEIVSEQESSKSGKLIDRLRSGGEDLTSQAGERARGLVSQGLERSAEALSNVSKLVGDTADGLDERLGPEFGEYARKAASAIENTANSIATKDADELIEDTRNFVRNSPGVAIAGAAIVGFALARLLKSGLSGRDDEDDDA